MRKIVLSIFLCVLVINIYAFDNQLDNSNSENIVQNENKDSLIFANTQWKTKKLGKGAVSICAQIPLYNSNQTISVVKYPLKRHKTKILHRPGKSAATASFVGEKENAKFILNGSYFDVKKKTSSVYLMINDTIMANTYKSEKYRVNAMIVFKDKKGKQVEIVDSKDSLSCLQLSKDCYSAIASGPLLLMDGEIVVPIVSGDNLQDKSLITDYSSGQFYDRRHPRTIYGIDDKGYAYLIAIDGRFKGKADGMTIYEAAYLCYLFELKIAINLDGGGSTTLWTKDNGVLNHPFDNKQFDHHGERKVPNFIAVY